MSAVQEPDQEIVTSAGELVELVARCAHDRNRPDLVRRLRRAQRVLGASAGAVGSRAVVRQVAAAALRALDSLAVDLRARRAMLRDDARTSWLRAELAELRARSERHAQVSREWPHLMAHDYAKVGSDLEFELRCRLRALIGEVEHTLGQLDPAKHQERLDAELRARLTGEARHGLHRLRTELDLAAANLTEYLGLPATVPAAPPAIAPEQLVAALPHAYRPTSTRPLPARVVTAVMPGYSGIVITLLVTRLLGVHLPGWLIGACAVVAALSLAGAKATGERKRQLDRRRADATRAVRATVEEFRFTLTKHIRDTLLATQLDLRRATTSAVSARGRALAEELDRVRAATETAHRAPAELAALARDLESLAELRERALDLRLASAARAGTWSVPTASWPAPAADLVVLA
jgi:hypothetical protein